MLRTGYVEYPFNSLPPARRNSFAAFLPLDPKQNTAMSWITRLGQLILVGLTAFGFKALLLFSLANGFVEHTQQPHVTGKFLGPSPQPSSTQDGFKHEDVPMMPWLSGISQRMDRQNQDFLIFMWPFVDGTRPDAALVFLNFAGAAGATWMLIVVESTRKAHQDKRLLAYVFPWGYLFFHYSHAMITPLYAVWNLFWSPLEDTSRYQDYMINRVETVGLIFSQIVAYLIPMALFAAPVPDVLSVFQKQTVVAWYQPWSVWIAVAHFLVTLVIRPWIRQPDPEGSTTVVYRSARSNHRAIYAFAFSLAAIPHVIVLSIALTAMLYPGLYSNRLLGLLSLQNVFIPPSPWSDTKAPHLVEGCKWLLQWDYITGSTGVLVWVLTRYIALQMSTSQDKRASWLGLAGKVLVWTVIAGPTAAAVEILSERDEMVFDAAIEEATLAEAKKFS
ncbi:hypothetical protein PISL3812_08210 [Talaromyces islandicus]|uniref:Uncharacterized protein n=1 Tax=Talaromyces islandicus TaxID=28573 RepID=A0A0U1M719_TALIS|nr:hypothetical protein PISL3812_08210 [Talaromyces islandicus]